MCEGRITLEEAKMLMADLTARKKAKQPKLTAKQWLNPAIVNSRQLATITRVNRGNTTPAANGMPKQLLSFIANLKSWLRKER